MHYFLYLRLDGLYARTLLEADHGLNGKPLVVHRDKRVIDCDAHAQSKQIYRGMALSEAKAILHAATFMPWEEEPYRKAQARWLDVCTEFSDVIEPDEQHSAWVDLSLHPDPSALAIEVRQTLGSSIGEGVAVRSGFGPSKWIAKLPASLPSAQHSLGDLKTRYLTPVDPAHRARLEFLGYATIGEVAQVPLNVLRAQFGEAATHIRMCARGGYFEPVTAVYPPNSIFERVPFEGSVEDLQTLDLALRDLALALSQRLSKEDKQAKDVVVTLEHESFRTTIRRRKFTKPIQSYASALASLRLMAIPPPEEPVLGLRARLENVAESKRIQQELTGRTTSADRMRGAMAAFQHIRTVFGDSAILTGGEVVEPRRKQVLRAWRDATGWV